MEENIERTYVVDSSFILSYLLPDEYSKRVQDVFEDYKIGKLKFISILLLPFEVINGLYASVLSKRIDTRLAKRLVRDFLALPIAFENIDYIDAFRLSQKYKVSIYDSSYLCLAKRRNISFLTHDKRLKKIL